MPPCPANEDVVPPENAEIPPPATSHRRRHHPVHRLRAQWPIQRCGSWMIFTEEAGMNQRVPPRRAASRSSSTPDAAWSPDLRAFREVRRTEFVVFPHAFFREHAALPASAALARAAAAFHVCPGYRLRRHQPIRSTPRRARRANRKTADAPAIAVFASAAPIIAFAFASERRHTIHTAPCARDTGGRLADQRSSSAAAALLRIEAREDRVRQTVPPEGPGREVSSFARTGNSGSSWQPKETRTSKRPVK